VALTWLFPHPLINPLHQAPKRGCHDITAEVTAAVRESLSLVRAGVLHVFIQHTSASLTVTAPSAGDTLEAALNALVPERWNQEFLQHTYAIHARGEKCGFGAGRLTIVLERGTNPELSRRTCTCEYGLQSWRGKSAGVVKS
jgi:hypothetical protein